MAFQQKNTNPELTGDQGQQAAPKVSSSTGASQAKVEVSSQQPVVSPQRPVVKSWQAGKSDQQGDQNMKLPLVSKKLISIVTVLVLVAGIGSGFALAYFMPSSGGTAVVAPEDQQEVTDNSIKPGAVFGVPDEKTFSDETQGVLIKGGLEGEGSHTLLRPGGESQNVYLTSSVVDLDQFNDMEIKIWGETFKGQKAGWLMDVGRVEVLKLEGAKPEWFLDTQE